MAPQHPPNRVSGAVLQQVACEYLENHPSVDQKNRSAPSNDCNADHWIIAKTQSITENIIPISLLLGFKSQTTFLQAKKMCVPWGKSKMSSLNLFH